MSINEDTSPTPGAAENEIWTGHTSQWIHFWYYFFCLLIAAGIVAGTWFYQEKYPGQAKYGMLPLVALALPLLMWIVRWWVTRTTTYELTTQRLKIHRGILNRRLEEIELYRVKDYVMDRPLFLRVLGLGHISLVTSDASTRTVVLSAIPNVETVREQLRTAVQSERDRKRVRELDVDDTTPTTM